MITYNDVKDLRVGDTVRLDLPSGTSICGKLVTSWGDDLNIDGAGWSIRTANGEVPTSISGRPRVTLTLIERAPTPVYTNSLRFEPVTGDVVRNADDPEDTRTWDHVDGVWGLSGMRGEFYHRDDLPAYLSLLVDGKTGFEPTP